MNESSPLFDDEHLKDHASREEYAKKIGAADTRYLEILAYVRADPKLTDEEKIEQLELPWSKLSAG